MRPRVLIHAEVELSAIDGSTSWVISCARAFSLAGARVDVLARNVPDRAILLDELLNVDSVRVLYVNAAPFNDSHTVAAEIDRLNLLNAYTLVLVRGLATAETLVATGQTTGVLWYYLVGLGGPTDLGNIHAVQRVVRASAGLFAQTPWLRDYVNAVIPESVGKTEILPPMVPQAFFDVHHAPPNTVLRIGYAGKFDKPWKTLEIPNLVAALAERDVPVEIRLHGDKVQAAKDEKSWHVRMLDLMSSPPPGVTFGGAIPRSKVARFMGQCDLGMGWRSHKLDSSYEISTKLLEFSASGTPVLCNDTAIHRAVFGDDYPLFVSDELASVAGAVEQWIRLGCDREELSARVRTSVRRFSVSAVAQMLRELLDGERTLVRVSPGSRNPVAYVHGYAPSVGRIGDLLDATIDSPVRKMFPRELKGKQCESLAGSLVFTDLSAQALSMTAEISGAAVLGISCDVVGDRGMLNEWRAGHLKGLVSADPLALAQFRKFAPQSATLLLDPLTALPPVGRAPSADKAYYVDLVIRQGDLPALRKLNCVLAEILRVSEGVCGVRVILLSPRPWEEELESATKARFARDFWDQFGGWPGDALEVWPVEASDRTWMASTAVFASFSDDVSSSWLAAEAASYGASFYGRTGPVATSVPSHRIGALSARTVSRAVARRARHQAAASVENAQRFARFVAGFVGPEWGDVGASQVARR